MATSLFFNDKLSVPQNQILDNLVITPPTLTDYFYAHFILEKYSLSAFPPTLDENPGIWLLCVHATDEAFVSNIEKESEMKTNLGAVNALYPSLTTILGAHVNGKPNFITIAHVGILNHGTPQYLSFGINKAHFTNQGIKENNEFSVNIPSREQVVETDYCGLVSGKNTDKSTVFELFYGSLASAPMVASCPVTMECRLAQVLDFKTHDIMVGEVVATHAEEAVLMENGKIDLAKIRPLLFDMSSVQYFELGAPVAGAWKAGKQLKRERSGV